jgi:cytochrome c
MVKHILGLAVLVLIAIAAPGFAQQSPPMSAQAKQTRALVEKAAALVQNKGMVAFAEFRKKDSEWFHDSTYLFAYDMKGLVLLNPAFPRFEGTNRIDASDIRGKSYNKVIIEIAENKGSGWVDYWIAKAGQTEPSQKWIYAKKLTIDGVPFLIASGFFPD